MRRFFAFLLCLGCCSPKTSPSPTPPPASTPPVSSADAPGAAAAACQALRAHGCPEAQPTPNGTPCEVWMTQAGQTPAGVDLACVAKISSCADVAKCGR